MFEHNLIYAREDLIEYYDLDFLYFKTLFKKCLQEIENIVYFEGKTTRSFRDVRYNPYALCYKNKSNSFRKYVFNTESTTEYYEIVELNNIIIKRYLSYNFRMCYFINTKTSKCSCYFYRFNGYCKHYYIAKKCRSNLYKHLCLVFLQKMEINTAVGLALNTMKLK